MTLAHRSTNMTLVFPVSETPTDNVVLRVLMLRYQVASDSPHQVAPLQIVK